jgi:hypothetical protein
LKTKSAFQISLITEKVLPLWITRNPNSSWVCGAIRKKNWISEQPHTGVYWLAQPAGCFHAVIPRAMSLLGFKKCVDLLLNIVIELKVDELVERVITDVNVCGLCHLRIVNGVPVISE